MMTKRKAIFDAVRRILGRGFSPDEVAQLDAALDSAMVPDAPSAPERPGSPRRVGSKGTALIKRFEGCARIRPDGKVEAYPDPGTGGAPWTIGWGSTGPGISPGTVWTQKQCDDRLDADLVRYAEGVAKALGSSIASTSQAQFDALVSFHYNTGAIGRATLTRLHRAGDFNAAAAEFGRWKHAGGRVLRGLVVRREAEEALYREGSR
jgi:GH24 family phage-related lysozyme (muramidase)